MSRKILIIATSFRPDSNSELLADAFAQGAQDGGGTVEKIRIEEKNIGFCRGCLACQRTQSCIINDDMSAILAKMAKSDVIVFATPVYFYEMCGQLKTLLDRTNPLFGTDYAFRDVYLLMTAADGSKSAMDGVVRGVKGWIACFGKTKLAGAVCAVGVTDMAEIKSFPAFLEEAYSMGKNV